MLIVRRRSFWDGAAIRAESANACKMCSIMCIQEDFGVRELLEVMSGAVECVLPMRWYLLIARQVY